MLRPNDVDHVVDSDDADQPVIEIDHRQHRVVVAIELPGHGLAVHARPDGFDGLLHEVADAAAGPGQQQVAEPDDPHQPAVIADHQQVLHALGHDLAADDLRRLPHGHVLPQGEVVGGHHAAGGLAVVADQLAQRRSRAQRHRGQDLLPVRLLHGLKEVRRVVRRHDLDEAAGVGQVLVNEVLHHARGQGRPHLRQGLGRGPVVHLLQDVGRLLLGQGLEGVGGVGRFLLLDRFGQDGHVDGVLDQLGDTLVLRRGLAHLLDVRGGLMLWRRLSHRPECTCSGWHAQRLGRKDAAVCAMKAASRAWGPSDGLCSRRVSTHESVARRPQGRGRPRMKGVLPVRATPVYGRKSSCSTSPMTAVATLDRCEDTRL
jgi:hypothetical protein